MVHAAAIEPAAHTVGSGKCALFAAGHTLARAPPARVADSFRPQRRYVLPASKLYSTLSISAPRYRPQRCADVLSGRTREIWKGREGYREPPHPWRLMELRA